MTYQEAYRKACERFREAKISDPESDAWILLEHVTGMERAIFWADGNREMKAEEAEMFCEIVEKRLERIPVQHLTGHQEFMGIDFLVSPAVLVPRQDTEILVEQAEKALKPGMKVLDMCTGSGCIAVSLAVRNAGVCVCASDISEGALAIAKENAKRQDAEVMFVHSNMFDNIEGIYDMIVSNPPYIPTAEIEKLEAEVKRHDPFTALDGREDGLYFYRILAKKSPVYLRPGGYIFMEIGYDQGSAVKELLEEEGFAEVRVQKDLAGLDRVVSGVYNRQ